MGMVKSSPMNKVNIFLDSSALIAGVLSTTGAAHTLLMFGEDETILLTVSEWVVTESEESLSRKSPKNIISLRTSLVTSKFQIEHNPSNEEIQANLYLIDDPDDVPILLAAMKAKVDYLATHDHKHFLDNPKVAERSGLKIGTPGDVLAWIRENLNS
jgi:predicted nucleic acid-binding protein